jgi:hypothetical protein
MAAGLIAANVVIQALFMSAGLRTFQRIEAQRPGEMAQRAATTTVIWILFLLIPIVLDVTLWATFYTRAARYRVLRKRCIFRPLPSRRSDTGTSFLAAVAPARDL